MDKEQKMRIAKAFVLLDDSIAESGGLADFLGKMLAKGFGLLVGVDLDCNTVSTGDSQIEGN